MRCGAFHRVEGTLCLVRHGQAALSGSKTKAPGFAGGYLLFPDAMRGTGEGHYPWDLQPKSTMTNASVEQVVTGVNGPTLMVKYRDGEKTIIVPPDVPVVTFAPGDKANLKPGTKIFILAEKKAARRNASSRSRELWQRWAYASDVTCNRTRLCR